MFTHNLDPILFDFGFMAIRWYSLAYIAGILIGWWLGKIIIIKRFQNRDHQFDLKEFDDLIAYLIISIIIVILVIMSLKSKGFKRYSLLMIVGGALGNLHDRIFFNAVPDFIDFHIGNFHWFIFNVSDIFITLGVISMIVLELFDNKNEKI